MTRRRRFVQSFGGGLLALAGCVTSDEGEKPETSERTLTTIEPPATGSNASVDDIVVYNWTDENHRVELVVTPVADPSTSFTDEFTLGPYDGDETDDSDSKTYPDVKQIDEECGVEVTVDDERSATGDWGGDARDYRGLRIHVDYGEIAISEKVA